VDDTVGELRAKLAARGELEDTLIVLVSDHGAAQVKVHLDLADWFRAHGVRTLSHPVIWEQNPQVAVMIAGNGSAMVYAQPNVPRDERWSMDRLRRAESFGSSRDLIAALTSEEAVGFVAAEQRPGLVRVACRRGEAEIERIDSQIRYRQLNGDPLELGGDATRTDAEWLEASWDGTYPDACVQLLDQFRACRTGDLLVIAREGFDFRKRFEVPEHKSGHGSLVRSHMQIPVWSNAPVPAGPLRSVDIFPAMLEWLGEVAPEGIDGQPVWSPARPARVVTVA
jgi:hypothetical protein